MFSITTSVWPLSVIASRTNAVSNFSPSAMNSHPPPHSQATSKTKLCSFCAEKVHIDAKKCKHCGELLDESLRAVHAMQHKPWNPGVAAVLSLVIPGAGQMYQGNIARGILLLIFTVVGYMIFFLPGLAVHIYAISSAYSAPAPSGK